MYRITGYVFLALLVAVAAGTAAEYRSPEDLGEDGIADVRLLARYGETHAAWTRLRRSQGAGGLVAARLEIRLLTEMERYQEADSILEHTALRSDDLFRHHLQRAQLNYLAGMLQSARDHVVALDSLDGGPFASYGSFLSAKVHLELDDVPAARRSGEKGMARGIPDALKLDFEELMARIYAASGETGKALARITEIRRAARDHTTRARTLFMEFELHAASGDAPAARRAALTLVQRYPGYEMTPVVVDEVLAAVPSSEMRTGELLTHAGYLTGRGQLTSARRLYAVVEGRKLSRAEREQLQIGLARYHYGRGAYAKASEYARPAFREPELQRQSMLILARSWRRSGRQLDAAKLYEQFARAYPNDTKSAEALYVAVRIYESSGRSSDAAQIRTRLRRSYPSHYFGRMATMEMVAAYADAEQYHKAIDILGRRVKRSRRTDESALFYLADVYRRTGDVDNSELVLNELRALDPFSFYVHPWVSTTYHRPLVNGSGTLSIDGEGGVLDFLSRVSTLKEEAVDRLIESLPGGEGAVLPGEGESCIDRGTWFLDAGFREWGEQELASARKACYDSPAAMLELARVYDEYAMPWRSVRLYRRTHDSVPWRRRRDYADDFRLLLYPTPYPTQVLGGAARYDLPPHLMYAMIREESRFDVDAVSRVGALGLMQLMPSTGRYVARELDLPEWVETDLLDPEINIAFGIWYAASLVERGGGDYLWMLAAYNAGPGNARRWFSGSDGDAIGAVDGIDYRETRNYVRRIVESANIYHSLYFGGTADLPR